jgi:hypothetical protein
VPHPRHDSVRDQFDQRCGYCGVSEVDTGGELTVDHFRPVAAGGSDEDENLVYACFRCNLFKSDFWPGTADLETGRRVLHPARDRVADHLQEDAATGRLVPLTETGRFHITLPRLNRPSLVEHRARRRLAELAEQKQALLAQEAARLRDIVATQAAALADLRERA